MKYTLNPHQKREPIGGHHFQEKGILIKADSFLGVVDLLTNFRLINARPVGNPRQEVIDYYAAKFPWMVEYDLSGQEDEPLNEEYVAWREWISSIWGKSAVKFVSRKEASMRWETCKGCPHNVGKPWKTSREEKEFMRKTMMLRRGEVVDPKYVFCRLHKADLSVSSFVESPGKLSRKAKEQEDHPGCWFSI
jgi:hypothetical protein